MSGSMPVRLIDIAVALLLAATVGFHAFRNSARLDPVMLEYEVSAPVVAGATNPPFTMITTDVWFDGDLPKVFALMSSRTAEQHAATTEHPLMSLVMYPPARAIRAISGLDTVHAARVAIAGTAGVWVLTLFIVLRLLGCGAIDAMLWTLLGSVSASATFWLPVPELFPAGSITILAGLGLVIWAARTDRGIGWDVIAGVVTWSMTVTNGMVGIVATTVMRDRRRARRAITMALAVVLGLWLIERQVFPAARFVLASRRVWDFIYFRNPLNVLRVIVAFVCHTIVMPAMEIVARQPGWSVLSVQKSWPGTGSVQAAVAVAGWLVLLATGVVAWWRNTSTRRVALILASLTAAQLGMHVIFGAETFLYSMHFLPLLILIAAGASLRGGTLASRVLLVGVIALTGLNNARQFDRAVAFTTQVGDEARALARH